MKTLLTLLLVTASLCIYAQTDYTELQNEVNNKAKKLKSELERKNYGSEFEKTNTINFKTDTFKIEEMLRGKLEIDYTTYGMNTAIYEAEQAYDILLNKYYKVLLGLLTEKDKEILKQAQRDWIKFRDSEKKLVAMIADEQYSGGGTMHSLTVSYETMMITKQRVIQLYNHISRFYEYGY